MSDVPPGTAFESLPEWICPVCYAAKAQFDELESAAHSNARLIDCVSRLTLLHA
jgi:hypothetical protein